MTVIREFVSTYFQFVTLSHRWEEFEPLLRDIKGKIIYHLNPNDGLLKLQSFCLATLRHGYFWVWSDTCCIDKESSAELPSLGRTSSPNIQNSPQSVISVREMHLTLSHLSRTLFVKPGIVLPCIVHRVKIVQTRTGTAATHVHCIQATGLEPIEVILSQPIENISTKPHSYILIRPWHSNLLDESVMDNDTSAHQWLVTMQQPFSALLLKQLQQNEYRRVATSCHILACPTDSNGVLEGEVTTLTIV